MDAAPNDSSAIDPQSSRYTHRSVHKAVIPGEGKSTAADGTTRLVLRHYPSIAPLEPPSGEEGSVYQPHIDNRVTSFKDQAETVKGDIPFTDETELEVTEASVFGKEKLPIEYLCESAMERTRELGKSQAELNAIQKQEADEATSARDPAASLQRRLAVAKDRQRKGRVSRSARDRLRGIYRREMESIRSETNAYADRFGSVNELWTSVDECAKDASFHRTLEDVEKRNDATVRSFLDQTAEQLECSASRLCPEDTSLALFWIEAKGASAEARGRKAVYRSMLDREKVKYREREWPQSHQDVIQDLTGSAVTAQAGSTECNKAFEDAFYSKYDQSSILQPPTSVEDWKQLWTCPKQQIGRIKLKTSVIHPEEGQEPLGKAEISQCAIYSLDGGDTWAPIDGSTEQRGRTFKSPVVSAWHLLDSRGVLPVEHMLKKWTSELRPSSHGIVQSDDSQVGIVPNSEADPTVQTLPIARGSNESRELYVQRARVEAGEWTKATQGPSETERIWYEVVRMTQAAVENALEIDSKHAEPKTEQQRTLINDWAAMTRTMLGSRQAGTLSQVHGTLAKHTTSDEQSRHVQKQREFEEEWRSKTEEAWGMMRSLQSALSDIYGSSVIPPSGAVWKRRFQHNGPLPSEAFACAAPSQIRDAAEAAEEAHTSLQVGPPPKSGGVPSILQETFRKLAAGDELDPGGSGISINGYTHIPNFIAETDTDFDSSST
ncbi:hypothetical protein IAT40_002936 [Kwoniella sp. CBS 6097]